ncbi:MAG: hypothetical protein KF698_08305 [Anaerolineales bacterium]|nr:hypothetical protein [Anaerolineales bacterium]
MMTNADLTLYNQYIEDRKPRFQRVQLKGVMWENRKARNVLASGGNIAADQAAIYIPMAIPGYQSPKAWRAGQDESGDEDVLTWTLQTGDIVVRGLVEDELTDEFGPAALKAKYDDVLSVSSVDTMEAGSEAMHHWQVGAK